MRVNRNLKIHIEYSNTKRSRQSEQANLGKSRKYLKRESSLYQDRTSENAERAVLACHFPGLCEELVEEIKYRSTGYLVKFHKRTYNSGPQQGQTQPQPISLYHLHTHTTKKPKLKVIPSFLIQIRLQRSFFSASLYKTPV